MHYFEEMLQLEYTVCSTPMLAQKQNGKGLFHLPTFPMSTNVNLCNNIIYEIRKLKSDTYVINMNFKLFLLALQNLQTGQLLWLKSEEELP